MKCSGIIIGMYLPRTVPWAVPGFERWILNNKLNGLIQLTQLTLEQPTSTYTCFFFLNKYIVGPLYLWVSQLQI